MKESLLYRCREIGFRLHPSWMCVCVCVAPIGRILIELVMQQRIKLPSSYKPSPN